MSKRSTHIRAAVLAGICVSGGSLAVVAASAATEHPATAKLSGSAAAITRETTQSSKVPGSQKLSIQVWMAGHEQAAQRFVTAVSTPSSSQYRRFLSPDAYTRKFGSTAQQVKAVQSFLSGRGLENVSASTNDDYVSATGSVAAIDRAFSVQMRRYETGGAANKSGTIETNDRDLTVPAAIRPDILAVTGLNSTKPKANTATVAPASQNNSSTCSQYWAQKTTTLSPAYDGVTTAANIVCGYSADQIRGAYGLSSADTGAGTTIALINVGGPRHMLQTLIDYAKRNGLPAPQPEQYREQHITQGPHSGGCTNVGVVEAALDSEAAYAMAPRAHQVMVVGNDCDATNYGDQGLLDAEIAPITGHGSRPEVNIESVSYGLNGTAEQTAARSDLLANHAILLRAAAEGVSVLTASGDYQGVKPGPSDPDVTAVGGTTLGVGANNQRVFETGWSTDFGERTKTTGAWYDAGTELGAGGGTSVLYREPGYQHGVVPATMASASDGHDERVVPDISADGDPATGMLLGFISGKATYTTSRQAGTSLATPLVAGMVADAEQGHDLGFLNPLLYSLNGTDAFNDILPVTTADPETDRALYTTGSTDIKGKFHSGSIVAINDAQGKGTKQATATGYHTMTGLGSPNGPAFTTALRSAK